MFWAQDQELSASTPWLLLKCILETVLKNGRVNQVVFYLPYNFGTVKTQHIIFMKAERGTAFDMKRDRN